MKLSKDEYLDCLRDVQNLIDRKAGDIIGSMQQDNKDKLLNTFQKARVDLSKLINKLAAEQFGDLAQQLDELSDDLSEGIAELNNAVEELNNFVRAAEAFTAVVGLAARIAAMAA